ncbi:MAG: hypothetical protein J7J07_02950 [Syntrophobacterales bacterium]|nr:hypothetical protein [Syntrophobacterales bacterium]
MNDPMQETLAATTILAARWNGKGNFINPMCGSGTLVIEATLMTLFLHLSYSKFNVER